MVVAAWASRGFMVLPLTTTVPSGLATIWMMMALRRTKVTMSLVGEVAFALDSPP